MPASLARLRVWLACLILLIAALAPIDPRIAVAAELAVEEQSATIDFPQSISFRLVAQAPGPVQQVELRYRPRFSLVTQVARPAFSPGNRIDISHRLDTLTNYLPPGIDILYRWRVTLADGSALESSEETLFYIDQRYDWRRLEEGQVSIFFYSGNDSFGQNALDITARSIERFTNAFDIQDDEPVHVVVYANNRDFSSALPPNSAEWIGGFADQSLRLIVTGVQPGAGSDQELRRILSHEVVHLVTAAATKNPFNSPPVWLDEGLATYYQEVHDRRFESVLSDAVRDGRLIPVRALNSSFPDDPEQALLSYAESESIVRFILEEKGEDAMARLIQVFREGVSYDQAVQAALGINLDQLDSEWKQWLDYRGDRVAAAPAVGQTDGDSPRTDWVHTLPGGVLSLAALLCLATGVLLLARRPWRQHEPT